MTKRCSIKLGDRDTTVLSWLAAGPLTVSQILALSETFPMPFPSEKKVRDRMKAMSDAGLVNSWQYNFASSGRSPLYFKLTRNGYRTVFSADIELPKRRFFMAIGDAYHHHTKCLSDVMVHAAVLAHRRGWQLCNVAPENSVIIEAGDITLKPDQCWQIRTPEKVINFVVELDNGTERVRTKRDVESIQRKLRGYDRHSQQYQVGDPNRYFVLFVTTRSQARVQTVIETAQETMANPDRSMLLATDLVSFLQSSDLLEDRMWRDNAGRKRSLVRSRRPSNRPVVTQVL